MLNTLGTIECRLNRPADAVEQHRRALRRARENRAPAPEVEALMGLADAHRELRDMRQAHAYADETLTQIRGHGLRLMLRRDQSVAPMQESVTGPTALWWPARPAWCRGVRWGRHRA
jgi:hypothetical protein